jgi:hypothetical protein
MLKRTYMLAAVSLFLGFGLTRGFADAISDELTLKDLTGKYNFSGFLTEAQVAGGMTTITLAIPQTSFPAPSDTLTISPFTVSLVSEKSTSPGMEQSATVTLPIFAGSDAECIGVSVSECLKVDNLPMKELTAAQEAHGVTSISVDVPGYRQILGPFENGGSGSAVLSISPLTVTLSDAPSGPGASDIFRDSLTVRAFSNVVPEPSTIVPLAAIGLVWALRRRNRARDNG